MSPAVSFELGKFRSLAGFLKSLGLPEDRAELWARAAVDRYRRARRNGTSAEHLFNLEHARKYAALDALGCGPRSWI